MRPTIFALAAALCLPLAAAAQNVVSGEAAQRMLFRADGSVKVLNPNSGMSEQDLKVLDAMQTNASLRKFAEQTGIVFSFEYYGVIAYSPDDGFAARATQGAFNYHSVEAAAGVALAACNRARRSGARPCVIAAQYLPPGYRAQPLKLSQAATNAFGAYARLAGEKSFAISPSSGAHGIGRGSRADAAAVSACNKASPRRDCRIVIKN